MIECPSKAPSFIFIQRRLTHVAWQVLSTKINCIQAVLIDGGGSIHGIRYLTLS